MYDVRCAWCLKESTPKSQPNVRERNDEKRIRRTEQFTYIPSLENALCTAVDGVVAAAATATTVAYCMYRIWFTRSRTNGCAEHVQIDLVEHSWTHAHTRPRHRMPCL